MITSYQLNLMRLCIEGSKAEQKTARAILRDDEAKAKMEKKLNRIPVHMILYGTPGGHEDMRTAKQRIGHLRFSLTEKTMMALAPLCLALAIATSIVLQ